MDTVTDMNMCTQITAYEKNNQLNEVFRGAMLPGGSILMAHYLLKSGPATLKLHNSL